MSEFYSSMLNFYWERESWSGCENIIKLIDNFRRDVDYFNQVNIESPFSCFSGIEAKPFSTRKMREPLLNDGEEPETRRACRTKKEELENFQKKSLTLDGKTQKSSKFEKKRIFRMDSNKKEYLFGIREIKGVMFKERKKTLPKLQ